MKFGSMMSTEYAVICNETEDIQYRKIFDSTKLHYDGIDEGSVRSLSVILALNDDYEGGELVFPFQDYKIKLKRGQLIAFPPYWTHPHYTNDLENGTFRYTINFWLKQ
jgi:predicted 2-oxoglutarate/Fe(II)-dependent dioxygenase YbiX